METKETVDLKSFFLITCKPVKACKQSKLK